MTDCDEYDAYNASFDEPTIRDVPAGVDMTIMPQGDPATQVGSWVYVVWKGRRTGLFYSW